MAPLAAIPLTLVAVLLVGTAVVRALAPRLPRDVELACGLGVGTGVVSSAAFALSALHLPSRAGALVALACVAFVATVAGGRPRLPGRRARRLLAPVAWFGIATLGLILLQPCPRGAWNFDWALHYLGDRHYADPGGIGDPELGFGWSVLSRPPLFNLARLPAELILDASYATAEAATVAIALVLPAGAWLLLREIAPPRRARATLWLLAASAFWVHLGAYPKPIALATGLALSCAGIVLRARRRSAPGLVPLAALLGAFAGVAHPVAGLGLLPVGIAALLGASLRERLSSLAIIALVSAPWPIWANHITGGNLLAHDPVRRFSRHAPLAEGLGSVTNMGWNVAASVVPVPLVGHATALATGARPSRDAALEVLLEAETTQATGAIGLVLLAALLVARPRAPPFAWPRVAALEVGLFAGLALLAGVRILASSGLGPAPMLHGSSVPTDNRLVPFALLACGLALAAFALVIARRPAGGSRRTADLLLATVTVQCLAGLVLVEKAEYSGIAHNSMPPAVAILALWAWSQLDRSRALAILVALEGASVLLVLGLGALLDVLPPDRQIEYKTFLGLASLHDALGPAALAGAPLLLLAAWRSALGFATREGGTRI